MGSTRGTVGKLPSNLDISTCLEGCIGPEKNQSLSKPPGGGGGGGGNGGNGGSKSTPLKAPKRVKLSKGTIKIIVATVVVGVGVLSVIAYYCRRCCPCLQTKRYREREEAKKKRDIDLEVSRRAVEALGNNFKLSQAGKNQVDVDLECGDTPLPEFLRPARPPHSQFQPKATPQTHELSTSTINSSLGSHETPALTGAPLISVINYPSGVYFPSQSPWGSGDEYGMSGANAHPGGRSSRPY